MLPHLFFLIDIQLLLMSSFSRFLMKIVLLLCILSTTHKFCCAQVRPIRVIADAITASSCTIGIAEINNGTLTSCTVQITLSSSLFPSSFSSIFSSNSLISTTRAILTTQTPRTTFSWSSGVIAHIGVVGISPVIDPPWCGNGSDWSHPYFLGNSLFSLQADIRDSRVATIPTEPLLDPQDSLSYFVFTIANNNPSLRFMQMIDSALVVFVQQGFPIRDAWVRDIHLGGCVGELVVGAYVYTRIRLKWQSTGFGNALRQSLTSILRPPFGGILQAPFSSAPNLLGGVLQSNQFMRYYNFASTTNTTSVSSTTQPERLQVQIVPQPVEGQATMTITTPSPLTADIRLVNMLGQTVAVLAQGQRLSAGTTTLPIASTGLASGVYAVQIVSGGRILHTQSVVVAR